MLRHLSVIFTLHILFTAHLFYDSLSTGLVILWQDEAQMNDLQDSVRDIELVS
jgi:hypothetical protein